MAETSKIEWCDSTFNPVLGCTNISPACDHCYAEAWSKRSGLVQWGNHPRRRTSAATWTMPYKWQANHFEFERHHGRRRRVFCASLADVFDNQWEPAWRVELWNMIRDTPNLDWLLLTKRPQNIADMLPADWLDGWRNVWLGATAEDAKHYRQRWPILARIPAAIRFISYEPALGPLGSIADDNGNVPHWLIVGGESGPNARLMKPQWVRDAMAECRRAGVAFFYKQAGTYPSNALVCEQRHSIAVARSIDPHGKGGQLLDGKVYHEFPI